MNAIINTDIGNDLRYKKMKEYLKGNPEVNFVGETAIEETFSFSFLGIVRAYLYIAPKESTYDIKKLQTFMNNLHKSIDSNVMESRSVYMINFKRFREGTGLFSMGMMSLGSFRLEEEIRNIEGTYFSNPLGEVEKKINEVYKENGAFRLNTCIRVYPCEACAKDLFSYDQEHPYGKVCEMRFKTIKRYVKNSLKYVTTS